MAKHHYPLYPGAKHVLDILDQRALNRAGVTGYMWQPNGVFFPVRKVAGWAYSCRVTYDAACDVYEIQFLRAKGVDIEVISHYQGVLYDMVDTTVQEVLKHGNI